MAPPPPDDLHGLHADLVSLRVEVAGLNATITQLTKIVRDGNGHPAGSLVTRMALLERAIENLIAESTRQDVRRWQVVTSLIAAGLSLAVAVATALWRHQ
jgi:hypothetical protein